MTAYEWMEGTRFKASADEAGAIIARIEAADPDGLCSPHDLVAAAKLVRNPLHEDIWGLDDPDAAYQYRVEIARRIIRSVRVMSAPVSDAPSFINVKITRGDQVRQGYASQEKVADTLEYRQYALLEAKRTLAAAKARYGWMQELAAVWSAIERET